MQRVNFHLSQKQVDLLKKKAEQLSIPVAELFRRIIDSYSKEWKKW